MEWKHEKWSIRKLVTVYDNGLLDLSPSYQRNPIWTAKSQRLLIDTILTPQPLPNFFIRKKEDDCYEMVDGQQRARTILAFRAGNISSTNKVHYTELENSDAFYDYPLNVTVITSLEESESIEEYYALVNSSGLRLNTPELRKAEHFDKRLFQLASRLADSDNFTSLDLFSKSTITRMNDVELVIELLTLIISGISEKKNKVDELFEQDITTEEAAAAERQFHLIVESLHKLNNHQSLTQTRFKQRADLYTLFDFISSNSEIGPETLKYYYQVLLTISDGISPSQKECDPLRDYARNCVSQSNSLNARENRRSFFKDLLQNPSQTPNEIQASIIDYYSLSSDLVVHENTWTIDIERSAK